MKHILLVAAIVLLGFPSAWAQEAASNAQEEQTIRETVQSYIQAFNRGDAKAIAAHWSEDGVYVSRASGERVSGRKAIEAEFAALFTDSKGTRVQVAVESIRLVGPNVAIEDGTARVVHPQGLPSESSDMAVHVKRDGKWQLDSIRETALPTSARSQYEYLKELEWMIGEWVDQSEESTVRTTCQWTANKNFITRSFKVSIKDRVELAGTQVIGWDPTAGQIRSWMFDSDGGFGEGTWTREGNRWIVKASRVIPDGTKGSAINILTYIDEKTLTLQSIGREIDGELLPNIEEVTVVRKNSNALARKAGEVKP